MTGLFETLIGAALGTAPAVAPRPRPRFAPLETDMADPQPEAAATSAAPPAPRDIPPASTAPAPPAKNEEPLSRGTAAALLLPQNHRPFQPPRSAETLDGPAEMSRTSPRAERPPSSSNSPPGTLPMPANNEHTTDRAGPPATATPAAVSRVTGTPVAAPPPGPSATASTAPLLPLSGRPRTLPHPPEQPGDRAVPAAAAPTVEVRIGRIEVRPPPPAVIARTRSGSPPRAAPRQSLTDYLASRRR